MATELLQDELPQLLRLVAPQARDAVLGELAAQAESRDFNESKRLVFAAIAAEDPATLREAAEWVRSTRLEDVAVLAMLRTK